MLLEWVFWWRLLGGTEGIKKVGKSEREAIQMKHMLLPAWVSLLARLTQQPHKRMINCRQRTTAELVLTDFGFQFLRASLQSGGLKRISLLFGMNKLGFGMCEERNGSFG